MEHFVGFMRNASAPSALRGSKGRKVLADLTHTAPRPMTKSAKTLVFALARMRDHGKHALTRRQQLAANEALLSSVQYAAEHCPDATQPREFAQLLSGAKTRAQDRAAQSSLRNGLTNAKGIFTDSDSYLTATVAALHEAEPSLTFTYGATVAGSAKSVSVHIVGADQIVMAAGTGTTCFYIRDSANGPGTEFASAPGGACNAATPPLTWATSWT